MLLRTSLCVYTKSQQTEDRKASQNSSESTRTPTYTELVALWRLSAIQGAYQLLLFLTCSLHAERLGDKVTAAGPLFAVFGL